MFAGNWLHQTLPTLRKLHLRPQISAPSIVLQKPRFLSGHPKFLRPPQNPQKPAGSNKLAALGGIENLSLFRDENQSLFRDENQVSWDENRQKPLFFPQQGCTPQDLLSIGGLGKLDEACDGQKKRWTRWVLVGCVANQRPSKKKKSTRKPNVLISQKESKGLYNQK